MRRRARGGNDAELLPRLLPRRDWRWLWVVTLLAMLAAAALMTGLGLAACGKKSSPVPPPDPCVADPSICQPPPDPPPPDPCIVDPESCVPQPPPPDPPPPDPVPPPPPPPPPEDCGEGLAAVDLAGTCRCKPQATMGALEVVTCTPGALEPVS